MYVERILNPLDIIVKKSLFLFGPRSTGKSSLIQHHIDRKQTINLLSSQVRTRLLAQPGDLEAIVDAMPRQDLVVIDEIQKVPELLDEVHRLIEDRNIRFLLTGSSARKLRKEGTNLLGGRAWEANLFPLTWKEIPKFSLSKYLMFGGLPHVWLSEFPSEELDAYTNVYLQQEILQEGVIRNLAPFVRFLKTAALCCGELINFASIGSDAEVSASTVRSHMQVLLDTLVGFYLEPWKKSKKRKAIQTAKFYYFDTGVTNFLAGIETIDRHSDLFGKRFEQFILMELRAYLSYSRKKHVLQFWRSTHGEEVDVLIGGEVALEIKASNKVTERHTSGLRAIQEEKHFKRYFLISHDKIETVSGNIHALYWESFLKRLWDGEIV